ncbi:MAG: ATP-dependent ligase [Burkholderiales bacterium]|nr:ATP-dependent ligase [Burkholderiales bacterium]
MEDYAAKRAFAATPEPPAAVPGERSGPLLFVIQQHSATRLHYDFRLECDGVLKSWAVPKGPSLDPADKRLAVPTEDHPFDYASFEGIIPAGQYGAGEVIVWDCGVYSPDEEAPWVHDRAQAERQVMEGLEKGKLGITLRGEKVKGSFALVKTSRGKDWLLIKHKDRFVTKDDVTTRNRSVLSGIAVDEMKAMPVQRIDAAALAPAGKAEVMPQRLEPMHAELADAPFNKPDWMWEPKLDGYRVLAFVDQEVRLSSRRGLELAKTFPGLAAELAGQGARMLLDGEIVAFDEHGRPSFNALQNRFQLKTERDIAAAEKTTPVVFYAFDLLHFEGIDLRRAPYADRRRYLAQCVLPSPRVQLVHTSEDGVGLYSAAVASGFEGVIGKRKAGRYESGKRSASWIKVKTTRSSEFVVGGYTKGKGSRAPLGALLVGTWEGKKLRYASHVGSGFDDTTLGQVQARLEPLRRDSCPFDSKPEVNAPTTWVEPKAVVEVRFQGWTDDGSLRAPVFLRLRDDIDPKAVLRGERRAAESKPTASSGIAEVLSQLDKAKASGAISVGAHTIKLSHLDRVYWPADPALKQPALTKRDLLRYLAQVSPAMLPHLADRPLTMIRMPDGINGQRFYQKHWAQEKPPFVSTITVFSGHKDESHEYLVCNNLPTLLWLAQSGTLEFHVWHSRARPGTDCRSTSTDYASSLDALESSVLNYPDYVVFDIDPYIYSGKETPGEEPELNTVAFEKGKEIAFRLRELLNTMSLDPIVKTSGKTGLHVFLPIRRTLDFDIAREISERVGRHLVRLHPKDVTVEWSVPKRTGKIFMDYNMNVRGKTLNVAYSPRGAPGAPVSMPLTWHELERAHPLDFRLSNTAEHLAAAGERWHDVLERKQSLEQALKTAPAE